MAAVPLSHMELSTRCELRSALWAGASRGGAGLQGQQSGGGGAVVAHGAHPEVAMLLLSWMPVCSRIDRARVAALKDNLAAIRLCIHMHIQYVEVRAMSAARCGWTIRGCNPSLIVF